MKKYLGSLLICMSLALASCGTLLPTATGTATATASPLSVLTGSPEAQIETGANTLQVAIVAANTLLHEEKISVAQATSYRAMLGGASTALDQANAVLVKCRQMTGSTQNTTTDPCKPQVADVIVLALDSIAGVKKTLDAK